VGTNISHYRPPGKADLLSDLIGLFAGAKPTWLFDVNLLIVRVWRPRFPDALNVAFGASFRAGPRSLHETKPFKPCEGASRSKPVTVAITPLDRSCTREDLDQSVLEPRLCNEV